MFFYVMKISALVSSPPNSKQPFLAAIVSNASNLDFFSFYKTAYFHMSVARNPTGKSHTSPVEILQKRKKFHIVQQPLLVNLSSLNYWMGTVIMGSRVTDWL